MKQALWRAWLAPVHKALAAISALASGDLNILNWSDYVSPTAVAEFSTGRTSRMQPWIPKTRSGELLSGHSGYDVDRSSNRTSCASRSTRGSIRNWTGPRFPIASISIQY